MPCVAARRTSLTSRSKTLTRCASAVVMPSLPQAARKRQLVPPGSATIKALDYNLKRWKGLTHFVNDGEVPISNHWFENQTDRLQLDDRIGCPPVACERASAQQPS